MYGMLSYVLAGIMMAILVGSVVTVGAIAFDRAFHE